MTFYQKKLLLIYPQFNYVPINFAYILPTLKRAGIPYDFIDLNCTPDFLENNDLMDYFAITTGGMLRDFFLIERILLNIKRIAPEIPLIVGGRVTSLPEKFLARSSADYFVCADAESTLPLLAAELHNKNNSFAKIPGLAYRDNGKFIKTEPPIQQPLDNFNPSWDDIDLNYYLDKGYDSGYFRNRPYPLVSGMGCVGKCHFCAPGIKGFRTRPVKNVIAELIEAKKKYNIYCVNIISEVFYTKLSDVEDFCRQLKEAEINLPFFLSVRADVNPKILEPLAKAGCKIITIGIESYDNAALNAMGKNTTEKQIDKVLEQAEKNNINLMGGFIIGNAGDNEESLLKTTKFFMDHNIYCSTAPLGVLIYPGTKNYDVAVEKGLIKDEWEYFSNFCKYHPSVRFTVENGIGENYPNITNFTNDELWRIYSKVSFSLYCYVYNTYQLQDYNPNTFAGRCYNCGEEINTILPIASTTCLNCFKTNYYDLHNISMNRQDIKKITTFIKSQDKILIFGSYHYKLAILKLCLENGVQAKDMKIIEENKRLIPHFQEFAEGLSTIPFNSITTDYSVIYGGLQHPSSMIKTFRDLGFTEDKLYNATTLGFKTVHKAQLKNKRYYFEYSDKRDLEVFANRIVQLLQTKYPQKTTWYIHGNCPYGITVKETILKSNLNITKNIEDLAQQSNIKCLVTSPRPLEYDDFSYKIESRFNMKSDDILGIKKDICPELWDEFLVDER